ncbi:MAG TPA: IclR family transcriptional regulator [Longimicrobiales bacterium]|nr:IclR family transcriptional regulator [Longimicrobiales bacterium]
MPHLLQAPHATAVDKALDVLFYLHEEREPRALGEIGRALSLPKSTTHRLLAALRRRALVEKDEGGRYQPGLGVLALAGSLLDRDPLVAAAHPILTQEAARLGETCFLVAARGGRLLVLEKAEGTGVLRVSPPIGSEIPARATAVGKVYLAHAPHLLAPEEATRYTERTIVDAERLAAEIACARARGYALNQEEWIEGLGVVAAPILAGGSIAGAVCTAMSSNRFEAIDVDAVGRSLIAAAGRIATRMEGSAT